MFLIRPLLDLLAVRFAHLRQPGEFLTVDEAMVRYKGHHHFRQYLKNKPCKWGFKVNSFFQSSTQWVSFLQLFMAADPLDGYCYAFWPYTTATDPTVPKTMLDKMKWLVLQYLGEHRTIVCDNAYVTKTAADFFLRNQTYLVGTLTAKSNWIPAEALNKVTERSPRGTSQVAQDGAFYVTKWKDKKCVCFLSSGHPVSTLGQAKRWVQGKDKKWVRDMVSCPEVVRLYQRLYRGVDKSDQLRSVSGWSRRCAKWYHYLVHACLELCIINASLLFNYNKAKKAHMPLEAFKRALSRSLISTESHLQRCVLPVTQHSHRLEHGSRGGPHGQCCGPCHRNTTSKCRKCGCFLCGTCFLQYHLDLEHAAQRG